MSFPRSSNSVGTLLLTAALFSANLRAEPPLPDAKRLEGSPVLRHLKRNPLPVPPRTPAESTVAQMYLPEGFRAELVASEPDLQQPVAFAFDERGRIWVAEAYSYPQKRPAGQGLDKIIIFEDRDGDGKFETRKVFAEGLNLISGLEVGYGGVWVGAAPELLFIPDRNHDDIPDGPPEVLLDGFGYQDTHECLNSFLWGPDGWLYGNQGVFNHALIGKPGAAMVRRTELRSGVWRYHPARHEFEVFAEGGSNQWGLDYDERGQIFMTHCRSYWGRGGTTHVIQGGCFWNQANANYPHHIIANPPPDFPTFQNYLLACSRYDGGAGGAGKPGSDAIYGGHAHVGTMIYLGDNWPDEYRGHLFTHNLGGHQINHEINQRLGSGFDTVHSGRDMLFCTDPKYVAVDLQYGPDGAVYIIDWYDQQHCHNPNTEVWERGSGRLYRMEYEAAYHPRKVDLGKLSDLELVQQFGEKNAWFGRMARKLLHERSLAREIQPAAQQALFEMAVRNPEPTRRLDAIWTLAAFARLSGDVALHGLADNDEYVRGWTIQALTESRELTPRWFPMLIQMAVSDPSPVVRRYLASAMQRFPKETAWRLAEALASHSEDAMDRNLPLLLWQGIGRLMGETGESLSPPTTIRALSLAQRTKIPQLADYIYWYAARMDLSALNQVVQLAAHLEGDEQRRRLAGLLLALEDKDKAPQPKAWAEVAPVLYRATDPRVQWQAEELAAIFGDESKFPHLREVLRAKDSTKAEREHAFHVLSRALDHASIPVFIELLDDSGFRSQAINLLGRFEGAEVSGALLERLDRFNARDKSAALNALTTRASFARALLDAVASGGVKREQLTAFHVRALSQLRDPEIDRRVSAVWGRILSSPVEKQTKIERLDEVVKEAPMWAYNAGAGRETFQKLCAQCHLPGANGIRLGPDLTGAGRNGVHYFLENIIDPNAVIGADYQMTTVETSKGEVISGLIASETAEALTMLTTAERIVVPKNGITRRQTSEKSLMPEGLLDGLSEREQLELLKFLTSN